MFSILKTSLTDKPLILQGEVWLRSLLGLKELRNEHRGKIMQFFSSSWLHLPLHLPVPFCLNQLLYSNLSDDYFERSFRLNMD